MITPSYRCEWGSNSIISKWMFHREGGSGIGTNSHFQKPTWQRHYQAIECKASPSNNSPDQVRSDRGVCLRYSSQRGLILALGPILGLKVFGSRLKVRNGDERWAGLPSQVPRPYGPKALVLVQQPPLDSCSASESESRTICVVLVTPWEAQPSAIEWTRQPLMLSQKERYASLLYLTIVII